VSPFRPHRRLVWSAAALLAVGVALFLSFEDGIRRFYWDLMTPDRGPDAHSTPVVRSRPGDTPYDRWVEKARATTPIFEGIVIEDVASIPLKPWPAMGEGVSGLYLRFADYEITDGRLLELPAGGRTAPQRHLFEMGVYFLDGPGYTLLFRDGHEPVLVDWQEGSVLSVPLNVRYQHFNTGNRPARLLAITSFPLVFNSTENEAFVFENDFEFEDRFDGRPDYFRSSEPGGDKQLVTNFVTDARGGPLFDYDERGAGMKTMRWAMAGNVALDLHVTEMPPRSRELAHRHTSDAFLLILGGAGYSLVWPGGDFANRKRIDWRKGTLFAPPTYWYHQHFNTSYEPSRHLAINAPIIVRNLGLRFVDQIEEDSAEVRAEWLRSLQAAEKPVP
jgi:gentisate 1,2-dioxygenase